MAKLTSELVEELRRQLEESTKNFKPEQVLRVIYLTYRKLIEDQGENEGKRIFATQFGGIIVPMIEQCLGGKEMLDQHYKIYSVFCDQLTETIVGDPDDSQKN